MAYTEIKDKNGKKYYYRVRTIRKDKKFKKQRIYLGKDLKKKDLQVKETSADYNLYSRDQINKLQGLEDMIPKIKRILKKYHVKKAGIFGSYARGEQKKGSDVDILIEPPKGIGWGIVTIENDLEEALNKKVDLVTYKYINHYLKKSILESEVRII